jgi:glycosyltransferase involved in cell wall biosynthesis
MKVLIVHNNYQQFGGEKLAVDSQRELLRQNNHEVIDYARENSEIDSFSLGQKAAFPLNAFYSRRTFREIAWLVRKEKPDIAHIHNVFPLISPAVYSALHNARIPIVQTVHNYRFLCPNGLFFTQGHICELCKFGNTLHAVKYKCYKNSYVFSALYASIVGGHRALGTHHLVDRFIVLNPFTAEKMVESQLVEAEKISVLENFLSDPVPSADYQSKEPYFIFMGRLSPEKGIDTLVRAALLQPSIRLYVLGVGPLDKELRQLAKAAQPRQIQFLGFVDGDRKWELLRKATASVIPSTCYENCPIGALESFAAGTPIVASNTGALPYIVDDHLNGRIFRAGDADDLCNKLITLSSNPAQVGDMSRRARMTFELKYTAKAHYQGLMKIYSGILQ